MDALPISSIRMFGEVDCFFFPTSPDEFSNVQKLDTVVDGKLPDNQDYASVFIKVVGRELSHGSSNGLYLRCRMNFLSNVVQTEAPQFVDLGVPAINTLNESSVLGTPATRIRMQTDGYHWTAPDHIFGEATVVGMSAARSDMDYSYKTDLTIWRKNQEL